MKNFYTSITCGLTTCLVTKHLWICFGIIIFLLTSGNSWAHADNYTGWDISDLDLCNYSIDYDELFDNPPPINDDCTGAIMLDYRYPISSSTYGATPSGLSASCSGDTSTDPSDTWYSFEADGTSTYFVIISTTTYWDVMMKLYSGGCDYLVPEVCTKFGSAPNNSGQGMFIPDLPAGTYYLRIFGYTVPQDFVIGVQTICPDFEPGTIVSVGAPCDDGNPNTKDDKVNINCECEGTPLCPSLDLYVGDACDDGNPMTIQDKVNENCECEGSNVNNDLCTNAISLECGQSVIGSTVNATSTAQQSCNYIIYYGIPEVWFTFEADGNSDYTITTSESSAFINVRSGECDNFTLVQADCNSGSMVIEGLTAGTYYISLGVGTGWNQVGKEFTIELNCVTQNDHCTNAIGLECGTPVYGNTFNATSSGLTGQCHGNTPSPLDVWYTFEANGIATYTVTVSGAEMDFDGVLFLYSGECGNLLSGTCSDNASPYNSPESMTLAGLAAGTYYIRTFNYSGTSSFEIELTCTCPNLGVNIGDSCDDGNPNTVLEKVNENCECIGEPIPENDDCDTAISLQCGQPISGYTFGATNSGLNTLCGNYGSSDARDVWYSFEADGSSDYTVTVSTTASDWDGVLFLYSGDCSNLVDVACADNGVPYNGGSESITFELLAAGTYYVRTFDFIGSSYYTIKLNCTHFDCPDLRLNLGAACDDGNPNTVDDKLIANCDCAGRPPIGNDLCSGAIAMSCGDKTWLDLDINATASGSGALSCGFNQSPIDFWYSFEANGISDYIIYVDDKSYFGDEVGIAIAVYSGDCNNLVETECTKTPPPNYDPDLDMELPELTAGTYYLRVTFRGIPYSASVKLSCNCNPGAECDDGDPNTIDDIVTADCQCVGQLAYDNCIGATMLECGQSYSGNTNDATSSGLSTACGPTTYYDALDVWYSFEADGSSNYTATVSTTNIGWDGVLYVYSGVCGDLVNIACVDNTIKGGSEIITLEGLAAGTYYVRTFSCIGPSSFTIRLDCCPSGNIAFVNKSAIGENDGSSWTDAFTNLQDALKLSCSNITEVWVAEGTYFPDQGGGNTSEDPTATFSMKNNLAIYGGFIGTETSLYERNLAANATILSGDIGVIGSNSDNSYNVITSPGTDNTSRLDGFTITGGNARSGSNERGGGIHIGDNSTAIIANCIIQGNKAVFGGGIYTKTATNPTIINCLITGNIATSSGGGILNSVSGFSTVINTTIAVNTKHGVSNYSGTSSSVLKNCIIWGNETGIGGGGTSTVSNSIVQDGYTGAGNLNIDPLFTAPLSSPGLNMGGDYSLLATSPAINAGSNNNYSGVDANTKDLAGNPRVYNYASSGVIDVGAYEFQGERVTIFPDANNIIYVDINVTGGNESGDSWTNALPELADALKYAQLQNANTPYTSGNPLKIFVATGTYKPLYSPADNNFGNDDGRDNSFLMVKNVQLYGGFAGTEATLAGRDLSIVGNETILSGDINGDDAISGSGSTLSIINNGENNHHVVISAGEVETALLDGITILGGKANGSGEVTVNNLSTNRSYGGGMYNMSSSPGVSNLRLIGNSAGSGAGMINRVSSSPILTNVSLSRNSATGEGGGMYNFTSSPILINATLSGNSANSPGGGILNYSSSPSVANSIIWGNTATSGKGIANISGSTPIISYSLVEDFNDTGSNNIDGTNAGKAPQFANPANGNYSLLSTSPAINAGSNQAYTDAGGNLQDDVDLAGNPRLFQTTIDMGAYEIQISPLNGSVTWNSACGARNATVKLYVPGTATEVESYDVSIQSDGSFNIPGVKIGTYDVIVKVVGYLAKGTRNVVIGADDNTLSVGSIINGNINNDGAVNMTDFSSFAPAFSSVNGSANYNPLADLNCDGVVNINDFSIFVNGFSQLGDSAPLSPLPAQ